MANTQIKLQKCAHKYAYNFSKLSKTIFKIFKNADELNKLSIIQNLSPFANLQLF